MTYKDLLSLDPEELNAKYKEVFGKQPVDLTKQGIASAISKQETDESDLSDQSNSNASESIGKDLATITEQRDILQAENIELKKNLTDLQAQHDDLKNQLKTHTKNVQAVKPTNKPEQKVIHLEKYEGGKVIETNVLTEAAWNNLPKAHKKDWKVKKPDELNS